eukprot:NODE_306_length_10184_cov_0.912246.p5 type:complete len:301 gc:universal NODE_306_length_10184_cov_0.912246:4701-3799(-)
MRKRSCRVSEFKQDSAQDFVEKNDNPIKTKRVYKYEEAPIYAQNVYILDGYRICNNFIDSWSSLGYLHNETGNIYTHVLASFFFLGILINVWAWETSQIMDKIIFSVFCLCAIKCFVCSTLFHLHCNQCIKTHQFFVCLDYSGISFMVMGSSFIVTYYLYYCSGLAQIIHLGFLTSLSLVGVVGSFVEYFRERPWIRVYVYLASGFASAIPFLMHISSNPLPFNSSMGVMGFIFMTFFYIAGALIYALRIPERYAPGLFDYIFHSHQIWHLFAFAAAVSTYCLALDVFEWHKLENQCYVI